MPDARALQRKRGGEGLAQGLGKEGGGRTRSCRSGGGPPAARFAAAVSTPRASTSRGPSQVEPGGHPLYHPQAEAASRSPPA